MKYILSIDQGTTGTTAALIETETYRLVGKANCEFPQIYPRPSWVEHDLDDIWKSTETAVIKLKNEFKFNDRDLVSIGITNQRETTCAFDRSGKPLANAIVWQDRRTSDFCDSLKSSSQAAAISKKTGLPIDAYFSGSKMRWLLKNCEPVKSAHLAKNLLLGTIDTYLLYKLTAGKSHCTEPTNASRTMLMDLESLNWDNSLLKIFEIDSSLLPKICNTFDHFGVTQKVGFLSDGIPITCLFGDQQSALFGQGCTQSGEMKCTYGTGAFLLLNTGNHINYSQDGLITTVAYKYDRQAAYALEGSCYIAGAAVQFLRDNLGFISKASEVQTLAESANNLEEMKNVLFLPFFTGLGSPYWKSHAKGAILGLTRDTQKSHIARACLEGICYSINDIIRIFKKNASTPLSSLKVDGGAVSNNFLLELQALISDVEIIRPLVIETTAYGAALGAAIGGGILSMDKISSLWKFDASFKPQVSAHHTYLSEKQLLWDDHIHRLFL